jgi:hypothetical protein
LSDILGFVLEAARGRRRRRRWRRWRTRRWRKVVRWVVRRGVGLGKGGGGGWLALLICKTANLRTLCLPALSSSFSTFSTTAFSSYGGSTRSFSLLSPSLSLSSVSFSLARSFARLISAQSLFLPHARFSALANTHTNPHCHSLALSVPFRLTCLRSLIPAVRPVSSTYLL